MSSAGRSSAPWGRGAVMTKPFDSIVRIDSGGPTTRAGVGAKRARTVGRLTAVVYTIGHSTHPIEVFLKLLTAHGVQEVVDVRRNPRSQQNPQYQQTALRRSLSAAGIRYRHMPRLGGLRHARKRSPNDGWIDASLRGFADHMQSNEFQAGLRRLEAEARKRVIAIMCAEAFVAWCHRSLIADALTVSGWRVLHIQSQHTATIHTRTPFLRVRRGQLLYPRAARTGAAYSAPGFQGYA